MFRYCRQSEAVAVARVHVETYGCTLNRYDTAAMVNALLATGRYEVVPSAQLADIIIVNTCAVKEPTENKVIHRLLRVPKEKKLVVTGCLPLINLARLKREVDFDGVAGPSVGKDIVWILDKVLEGEKVEYLRNDLKPELTAATAHSGVVLIVPVALGCTGACSYCCVRFARGRLRSYEVDEVVAVVREGVKRGVKEIWLTGQDLGAYGVDIGRSLPELLESVCRVDGDFMVRVGMINPEYAMEYIDELATLFAEEKKLFKFAHLPVQSGSDRVLRIMNRRYRTSDFLDAVKRFRSIDEKFAIMTDIIVGHPGEKEEDFEATVRLLETTEPDAINLSKFYPRPGTPSARMKKLDTKIVKERSEKLTHVASNVALKRNALWVGWRGWVIVDEVTRRGLQGRNYAYRPVAIPQASAKLGSTVTVEVTGTSVAGLRGRIVG